MKCKSVGGVMVGLLLTLSVPFPAAAQFPDEQGPPVFRSSLDVVTIQASVRDRHGRPVDDLLPSDFDVSDGGLRKPILSMQFNQNSPVSVAVLLDTSGSMRLGTRMDLARLAFEAVRMQLRPAIDEVGVFSFDSRLHERRAFTSNMALVKDAFDDVIPFGTTSLNDAIEAMARRLSERTAVHKAIVVVTDGLDTSSSLTAREVAAVASLINVPVYVIATLPSLDHRVMQEALRRPEPSSGADLRDLADWTGGRLVFASTDLETAAVVAGLLSELRQQYVLAIEAGTIAEWRRLDVRVKRPAVSVRARSG